MRQLLILGFHCDIYKKEPLCRVYVNDVLLDEFDIPQSDAQRDWVHEIDQLDPFSSHKWLQHFTTNTLFLKCIEFDDAGADSLDVIIKIQNDDNNHANGFMSKHTNVTLSHVFLASEKLLENVDNIQNNFKFSRKNWEKYNRDIVDFYADDNRTLLFKNHVRDMKLNFPGIQPKSNENTSGYRIGTSGHYHLAVKKKLGFWRTSKDHSIGYCKLGENDFVKYIYNKYKQHEDQRNTDQ